MFTSGANVTANGVQKRSSSPLINNDQGGFGTISAMIMMIASYTQFMSSCFIRTQGPSDKFMYMYTGAVYKHSSRKKFNENKETIIWRVNYS